MTFYIEIIFDNPFATAGKWFLAEGDALDLARRLSENGQEVRVSAMARIRAIYKGGVRVKDSPDLGEFYDNVTSVDRHLWTSGRATQREYCQ